MKSVAKKNRRKSQREAARLKRQGAPGPVSEDPEVHFRPIMDQPDSSPPSPSPSPVSQGETEYGVVLDMVQNLRDKVSALILDNENIRAACDALRRQCQDQGAAFGDLTKLVKESLDGRPPQRPQTETGRPHPIIRADLIDNRGNLRAADIGITWQGGHFPSRCSSGRNKRGHGAYTSPTGDVYTILDSTRTSPMWYVNTTACTIGVSGNP